MTNYQWGGGKYLIINEIIKEIKIDYGETKDYKFFCFGGKVRFFKIDYGRFHQHYANYYSPEGELLPFGESDFPPQSSHVEQMPENLCMMIQTAEKLSEGHKFLRVDLYSISGKIYFGELTFYPAGGLGKFTPDGYDLKIGNLLDLTI